MKKADIEPNFNVEVVEHILQLYPKWENIICAGTVSLKATRELLRIDRYECYAAYLDLLEAGAIYGSGSNCYRATQAMKDFVNSRRGTTEE